MDLFYAKTPSEYQEVFYRQIGLYGVRTGEYEMCFTSPQNGLIRSYGSIEQIQFGTGSYRIPSDFLVEYQYHTEYLHFGIIYEGITYSLVEDRLEAQSIPSAFLAVEQASGGVNCWKEGQRFKGVEVSIEMTYLKTVLLPFLQVSEDALCFLEGNVRYIRLPKEMQKLIRHIEHLLLKGRMTKPLQISICLEFIAHLLHPENREIFNCREQAFAKYIQLGKRKIKMTKEDFQKVVTAHERIEKAAASFYTIYELSRELGISEQKLKAGFKELYQRTIWDYANSVRMNAAVSLLQDTDLSIKEISRKVGYQSQVAFINMFKKWSGTTPLQFRVQAQSLEHLR